MLRFFAVLASLLFSFSAFALDHIPTEYKMLTHAEGPAVAAHLETIDWTKLVFNDDKCSSSVDYSGDTKLTMGTETYKLIGVVRMEDAFCPGAFHLEDYDAIALLFVNTTYGNQMSLSLDKNTLPHVDMVLNRGLIIPGKALN